MRNWVERLERQSTKERLLGMLKNEAPEASISLSHFQSSDLSVRLQDLLKGISFKDIEDLLDWIDTKICPLFVFAEDFPSIENFEWVQDIASPLHCLFHVLKETAIAKDLFKEDISQLETYRRLESVFSQLSQTGLVVR